MAKIGVLLIAVAPPTAAQGATRIFAKLDNREVFMRTIELYASREVAQQILCVGVDDLQTVQAKYAAHLGFQGVGVAAGGPDWFGVVARGLEKLKPEIDTVIVHDACRPAVPYTLLDALEAAVGKTGAAAPVVALGAHVARTAEHALEASVEAENLYEVQSPQIFTRQALTEAYGKRAGLASQKPADDAALVRLAGGAVTTVAGSAYNVRIGSDELVRIGGDYLKHLPKPRKSGPISPFDEAQW